MRVTFSSTRSLEDVPDDRILELANEVRTFPEILIELFWESVHRRMFKQAQEIRHLFKSARETELDEELDSMDELVAAAERDAPSPAPAPPPSTAPPPAPAPRQAEPHAAPKSWLDTAALIRNAVVQQKANELARGQSSDRDWAKHSPLNLLGYKVGRSGLASTHRHHFLYDFVMKAELPRNLPASYLAEWGGAGSKVRLQRTARHIVFQRVLRESNDSAKYVESIRDWSNDIEFLQGTFSPTLTSHEWAEILRT